jgi:hypothetical protein
MAGQLILAAFLLAPQAPMTAAEKGYAEFVRMARAEIEDGSVIAVKPALSEANGSLKFDAGDVDYEGLGDRDVLSFKPMQNQLRLELLRRHAFPQERDLAVAAPFLAEIEKEIKHQWEVSRKPDLKPDTTRKELRESDQKIAKQLDACLLAIARSRGLARVFVTRAAHAAWRVQVIVPRGAFIRYTPFLNYLLCSDAKRAIDWTTAQNGDVIEMRGKYRIELVRDGKFADYRQPKYTSDSIIQFE